MLGAYSTTRTTLARSVLSLVLRTPASSMVSSPCRSKSTSSSSSTTTNRPHDPLTVTVPVDEFGLPLTPLETIIPSPIVTPTPISSQALQKLHRLSALNPPPEGSPEEKALIDDLGELVGLMEVVKGVELPDGPREKILSELLGVGVGEIVIGREAKGVPVTSEENEGRGGVEKMEKNGKELLKWATRRVGDYYASRVAEKR